MASNQKLSTSIFTPIASKPVKESPLLSDHAISQLSSFVHTSTTQLYQSPWVTSNAQIAPAAPLAITPTLLPAFSGQVNEILQRVRANNGENIDRNSPQWEAARQSVLADISAPTNLSSTITPTIPSSARTGGRRGRGPRRRDSPRASGTIKVEKLGSDALMRAPTARGRSIKRGGSSGKLRGEAKGLKRKREDQDDEKLGEGVEDTDDSEAITPLPSQSRSGRKIFPAISSIPVIKTDDNKVKEFINTTKTAIGSSERKKKVSFRRIPGAAAVCKNCGRGHSPSSNVIVFCDGCDQPWHQFCHDPIIKGEVLQVVEAEWFCSECALRREESACIKGKVAGDTMSLLEKRHYLETLPREDLVSLLLHACFLHPNLPLFAPKTQKSADQTNSPLVDVQDIYEDDYVLPYPKAGNGIILPLETEDLGFLIDEDIVSFSHVWTRIPDMIVAGKNAFPSLRPATSMSTLAAGA